MRRWSPATKKRRQLVADKKFAEARTVYQDLLAKYPQAVNLHSRIAWTYESEGQFGEAVKSLQKYLETDKQNIVVWSYYAVLNAKAGNADEALRVLTAVPPAQMKDATDLQECGFALFRADKATDAVKFFDEAVKRFPDQAVNYFYRGVCEAQIGLSAGKAGTAEGKTTIEKAKADLNKFLGMAPANAPEIAQAKKILDGLK